MGTAPLASVTDLADWLGEPIEAYSVDEKRAEMVLNYASVLVREHTGQEWADDSLPAGGLPEKVRMVTLQVAARGYSNPDSWGNERLDDWGGGGRPIEELGMYLTATEKAILGSFRPRTASGLGVVRLSRDKDVTGLTGYVPTVDGPPIPWY